MSLDTSIEGAQDILKVDINDLSTLDADPRLDAPGVMHYSAYNASGQPWSLKDTTSWADVSRYASDDLRPQDEMWCRRREDMKNFDGFVGRARILTVVDGEVRSYREKAFYKNDEFYVRLSCEGQVTLDEGNFPEDLESTLIFTDVIASIADEPSHAGSEDRT